MVGTLADELNAVDRWVAWASGGGHSCCHLSYGGITLVSFHALCPRLI